MTQKTSGFSLLMVVLILSAVCLAMVSAALWLGVDELATVTVGQGESRVLALANGCLENALERLKIDSAYRNESLSLAGDSCIITVEVSGTPASIATLTVNATSGEFSKKIKAEAALSNDWSITSWQELAI